VTRLLRPVKADAPSGSPVPHGVNGFSFRTAVDYQTGFERQNPRGAVEAFCLAFEPGTGPQLVIEETHAARFPAEHALLMEAIAHRPDITVRHDAHEDGARRASCFVSLHRSEGTGLELARAMRRGIPTIVTGHSFSVELQDKRDSLQVPYALTPIPEDEYRCERGGLWAEPDLDAAAGAMRLVIEQPKLALAKARRAQERARRQFSPYRTVRVMRDRITAIDHRRKEGEHSPSGHASVGRSPRTERGAGTTVSVGPDTSPKIVAAR
jgi:hypothetical protein